MAYKKSNANGQATMANSEPVVIASDQSAVPFNVTQLGGTSIATNQGAASAGTQRVVLANEQVQDLNITGQGTQTVANNNIVLATAGTGSTDANGYRTVSIQIIPTGTVSSGVVTFEGSNDNTTFVAIPLYDEASLTANPISTVSPATGVNRFFKGPLQWRYFRARISTVIGGGGSIAAVTRFSQSSFAPDIFTVTQATAANLQTTATIASGTVTTVSTLSNTTQLTPGTAATNLGKARDSAIGATDTGVAILGVRRDSPTAETPVAGDYVVPQISANGEQWVRLAGELADDAAFTPATTRVVPVGFFADETATDSVDEGDIGAGRMTLDRKQIVANYAHTAGGATPYQLVSAASTNATSVKASAGQIYMITASNVNAAARYLKLYNKASAPTVGTDTPVLTFIIPGNTAGAGTNIPIPACGITFSTGIAFALTTEATVAGTTGVALSEIVVNLAWL